MATESVQPKVGAEDHEDQEGEDLEGEPRNHYVIACGRRLVLVGFGGCESTSSGLQEQGQEIAGDELFSNTISLYHLSNS